MDEFKFQVGSTHENMKGAYQVISIHHDTMVIRWSDGSEATTTVELQKRILERMAHEKGLIQPKTASKAKAPKSPKPKTSQE